MKFNKLEVPYQWKDEFTKYPHGYTIFEALCSWTKQVDNMVDNQNNWNDYLDKFVENFEFELQEEVQSTIERWQNDGLLDGIIESALNTELDNVKTELAQNEISRKLGTTHYSDKRTPTFTFIDDDGHIDFYNNLKPVFDTYNVKAGVAIISDEIGKPNRMSKEHLDELFSEGYEILGHSMSLTTERLPDIPESELEYQIGGNVEHLRGLGYDVNGFVAPGGQSNVISRTIMKKYVDFHFEGTSFNNKNFLDSMKIRRVGFGSYMTANEDLGTPTKDTLEYFMAAIDKTIEENNWLVFMLHAGVQPQYYTDMMSELILYIKQCGGQIKTPSEAYKIFGNKVYVGDYESGYVAINEKDIYRSNGININWLDVNAKNATDLIPTYDRNTINYMPITQITDDYPELPSGTGLLTTYRNVDNRHYHVLEKQEFFPILNPTNVWVRYVMQGGDWSPWRPLNFNLHEAPNKFSADDPITAYEIDRITTFRVDGANSAGFGEGGGGVVTTYRSSSAPASYQEFKRYNKYDKYIRYVDGNGEWTSWRKFMLEVIE